MHNTIFNIYNNNNNNIRKYIFLKVTEIQTGLQTSASANLINCAQICRYQSLQLQYFLFNYENNNNNNILLLVVLLLLALLFNYVVNYLIKCIISKYMI